MPIRFLLALALFAVGSPSFAGDPPPKLTVFAAASLQESLDAAGRRWTQRTGQDVVVSYAASSALARQIEQGAPADLFISADEEWMDYLAARALIDPASRFDLVGNRLVVVVPLASAVQSVRLDAPASWSGALGTNGRLAIAETQGVPAGRYAREALTKHGVWDALSGRLAQGDNVRAALAFVARGEAPVGIVYATDAKAEPKVRVVATFAEADHRPIVYPAARVAASESKQAQALLVFLQGDDARAIFSRAGFVRP